MNPIQITDVSEEQRDALEDLYRKTHDVRLRTRAQMVLLSAEQHMTAAEIAVIVRESQGTVRCWLKRYLAEGIEGLHSLVGGGAPGKVTTEYQELLLPAVRRHPRSLGQPYSMWSLQRRVDYLAEQTGIRVQDETVRVHLKEAGIVLSRPQHTISSPDPEYLLKKRRLRKPVTV
ncbi:MAG TPA: helix-turn-helix domain-containing protein [Ktedonobacteraceae bacterium]